MTDTASSSGLCVPVPYAEPSYWDKRYQQVEEDFEWFYGYSALRRLIRATVTRKAPVLHIGCGTSRLPMRMADDGYTLVNTDICEGVVDRMREHCADYGAKLQFMVSDVTSMPEFHDMSYQSVIDKGTLDALVCDAHRDQVVGSMMSEISRVLRPKGTFLLVTLGEPSSRLCYLCRPEYGWTVQVYLVSRLPQDQMVNEDGRSLPVNDTTCSVKPIGPLSVEEGPTGFRAVGMPEPFNPKGYFYGYVCTKQPLVLPTSSDNQRVQLGGSSWKEATRKMAKDLQASMGLSKLVLHRNRVRHVKLVRSTQSDAESLAATLDAAFVSNDSTDHPGTQPFSSQCDSLSTRRAVSFPDTLPHMSSSPVSTLEHQLQGMDSRNTSSLRRSRSEHDEPAGGDEVLHHSLSK